MKRVLLLFIIFMILALPVIAADTTSIKTISEPAAGDSVATLITYEVGDAGTDWFSVAFTANRYESFDTDFSDIALSTIPLSLDGDKAVNTSPVYVSWIIVTNSNVNVSIADKGILSFTGAANSDIPFSITSSGVTPESDKLILCKYRDSSVYGTAGSKEISIITDKISGMANGKYEAVISILVESAS